MRTQIKSATWGWLAVDSYKVDGPLLVLVNATRESRPFHRVCMIPIQDVQLIVPGDE